MSSESNPQDRAAYEAPEAKPETAPTRPASHGRRGVIISVLFAAAFAGWLGWHLLPSLPRKTSKRLNVVLVSIDTCRADRLSCYGYKRPTTPHIDALAREGALFKMALTPVPMTTPSHCSMFTGTSPLTTGVHLNQYDRLDDSNVTLATMLRDAGYQTAGFIASFPLDPEFGVNQGFETYDGRFDPEKKKKGVLSHRHGKDVNLPALAWLDEHAQEPFFLFVHYFDAHLPYEPSPPYSWEYSDDRYAGQIAYIDECIGQVVGRLRTLGVYDNTLVIVTGDHGEGLGDHGETTHSYFIYNSTLHVPLVIHEPNGRKGVEIGENVSLIDIVPTVLDLAGLKIPERIEGVSLRPAIERGTPPDAERPLYEEALLAGTFGCSPLHGIVEGHWKYVYAPRPELYDLSQDPGELTNLIDKEPQTAQRLRARLEAMVKQMLASARKHAAPNLDREALKKLESLGYAGGGKLAEITLDAKGQDPKDFLPTHERLSHAQSRYNSGLGDLQAVKKDLLEIDSHYPGLILPQRLLGEIAMDEKRPADSVKYFTKLIELLENNEPRFKTLFGGSYELAEAHFDLGKAYQKSGNVKKAIENYEEVVRRKHDYAEAYVNWGLALQEIGKTSEAAEKYRKAIEIKPEYADARLNLGNTLDAAGKFDEAIAQYQEALRIKPDYALAYLNLGNTYCKAGRPAEAVVPYESALRIEPELEKADPDLKGALKNAKIAAVFQQNEEYLRLHPEDAAAQYDFGNMLRQAGHVSGAIEHYKQALKLEPDDAGIHYNLAVALGQAGNLAEAAKQYAETLRLKADQLGALNNLAWIRATCEDAKLRDGAEAVRLAEKACQLTARKEPAVLGTLAAAYAEAGRFPEAVAATEEELALAKAGKKAGLAESLQSRLTLYKAGKPYREAAKPRPGP